MTDLSLDLLPIGIVVKLKDVKKPIMIYGRHQLQTKTKTLFDYIAVPYPERNLSEEFNVFFNRQFIEKVLYKGFVSPPEDDTFIMTNGNPKGEAILQRLPLLFFYYTIPSTNLKWCL